MIITPDLKQNIAVMAYLLVADNFFAIVYAMGILVSIFLALKNPSRASIILLLGFILLLFGFEYQKHILEGLRIQTLNSLITIQEHNKVRRIIDIILVKAVPILLPLSGWIFVITSIFLYKKEKKLRKRTKHE